MSHKQANSPGLFDALTLFRRRFRFLVFGTLFGTAVAAAYFWMSKPLYESVSSFVVNVPDNLPGRMAEPTTEGTTLTDDILADHVFILESREVIGHALETAGLKDLESIRNNLEEDQTEVEYVSEHLRVTRGGEGQLRNARVITLRLRHTDAEDCAAILNAILASYKQFIGEQSGETGEQSIESISEPLNIAKQEFEQLRATYKKFRNDNPQLIGNQIDRINPYEDQVKKWNDSLYDIHARKIETQSRIDAVRTVLSQAIEDDYGFDRVEVLQKISGKTIRPESMSTVQAEVSELWDMMLREKDLLEQYGSGHPLVERTRTGIVELKGLLTGKRRQMERSIAQLLVADLQELNRREIEETNLLNQALDSARKLDQAAREDIELQAQVEQKRQTYDMWKARFNEASIGKTHGTIITKTLAPVEVGEPINTSPVLILALGMMVGLFIGLGFAVVADNLAAGAAHEAETKVTRQPRAMNGTKLPHIRPNVGAAV